jgi:hypothetical protein
VSGEFDLLQFAVRPEFYAEMNLIAARGVIAMNPHRCVSQIAEIPRAPRMIENDFLIKLF